MGTSLYAKKWDSRLVIMAVNTKTPMTQMTRMYRYTNSYSIYQCYTHFLVMSEAINCTYSASESLILGAMPILGRYHVFCRVASLQIKQSVTEAFLSFPTPICSIPTFCLLLTCLPPIVTDIETDQLPAQYQMHQTGLWYFPAMRPILRYLVKRNILEPRKRNLDVVATHRMTVIHGKR